MYKGKRFLAIIPARSGSKGLVDKNIKLLNNKPLMGYTIEAAVRCNIFDNIILSTDSKEYGEIGKKYGATVPFLREKKLATDNASTKDVILDVIRNLENMGEEYDYFVLLQPTTPLRNEINIIESIDILINNNANSVVSICELEHSSSVNVKLNKSNRLDFAFSDLKNIQRQDFQKEYRINGAIYISNIKFYLEYKSFYREKSYPYIMDKNSSVDIDNIDDFMYAEYLIINTLIN